MAEATADMSRDTDEAARARDVDAIPAEDRTPEELLDGLGDMPLDEHPAAFAAIDEALTSELGRLDDPD